MVRIDNELFKEEDLELICKSLADVVTAKRFPLPVVIAGIETFLLACASCREGHQEIGQRLYRMSMSFLEPDLDEPNLQEPTSQMPN